MNKEKLEELLTIKKWLKEDNINSKYIEITYSSNKGRYFISKEDIPESTILFIQNPFILMVNESRKQYVCDWCSYYDENNIENKLSYFCNHCKEVYYCQEVCQRNAWKKYHQLECKSFQHFQELSKKHQLHKNKKNIQNLYCLGKLLIRIFYLKSKEKNQALLPKEHSLLQDSNNIFIKKEEEKKENFHSNDHFTCEDLILLCSNRNILPKKKIEILKNLCKIIYEILKNDLKKEKITENEILEFACREESNAFGLYYPLNVLKNSNLNDSTENRLFAFGFYITSSLFNHSCAPNIYKILKGQTYYFITLHDIPKGTELCISYIDLDKNTNQRRNELLNHYGFYCNCKRCEDDDLDDIFLNNYICTKYGCGGLLIKNTNYLQEEVKICHKCGIPKEIE